MAKIIWIGAFPPTLAVGESWRTDLYTQEGVSVARMNRGRTNDRIRSSVQNIPGVTFIDPPVYNCTSNCDGIHLPQDVASNFVSSTFSSAMASALSGPIGPVVSKLYNLNEYLVKNNFDQEAIFLKSFL